MRANYSGFRRKDFQPVATNGWGDPYNAYAHSMAWFRGHLYVGTARANLHLIRRRIPPPQWSFYPVNAPDDPFTLDLRAQIWRFDPIRQKWQNVHTSPIVKGRDDSDVPREIGVRGMAVFQGPSDDAPVLYVGTFSPTRAPGPMILRSEDGEHFKPVSKPGFNHEGISAFRSLVPFNGKLYTSPVGATGNRPNVSSVPVVFESTDPARGKWKPVSPPGFENPHNTAIFEMVVFNNCLYAGTFNAVTGFELWKTDGEGKPPYKWELVMRLGAYRGNLNEGALSLCVFNNALYIGTGIQDGGYDRANRLGPAAGEIIRLYPDDTWSLVVGDSRTPHWRQGAPLTALSGRRSGFGNLFNGYIWRMCAHEDTLYAGTFDWSTFLPYSPVDKWPVGVRKKLEEIGIQTIVDREGGCDIWSTGDGVRWSNITRTGFGNPYNCGARTMASTPHGLFIGTTNPFGPEVAMKTSNGWTYEPNPQGGAEIWMGSAAPLDDVNGEDLDAPLLSETMETHTVNRRRPSAIDQKYGREMYGELANEYYEYSDYHNFGYWLEQTRSPKEACENLLKKLLSFIRRKTGSILDVGCGKGATTRYLLKHFDPSAVTGIDYSEKNLRRCRVNAPRCRFLRMDATRMRFRGKSFDNIISVEAAFHFDTRQEFLREAHRILKPGGRLVLSDIISSRRWEQLIPQRHEENFVSDLAEYRAVFKRAGFERVRIVDATRECWDGFAKNYRLFLRRQLLTRSIDQRTFAKQMALLAFTDVNLRHYVLVVAQKRAPREL